jgi:membrane protein implicated in regulation of membrane protease activity
MNTATVVIALIVLAIVAATVAVVLRERRDRALAARLDESDPGAGVRAQADAERQQAGTRGEAGGSSWSAAGGNSA